MPLRPFRPVPIVLLAIRLLCPAPASAQTGPARFDSVRAAVKRVMAEKGVVSVAIAAAKGGRLVWEEAFGWADLARRVPATPTTMYSLASISKPITATGLMVQVGRGKVALDRPANDYLADAPLTAFEGDARAATVRLVANHTAGLPLHYQFFYQDRAARRPSQDDAIRHYGILVAPPGTQFTYSNLGYGIIERIIERTAGTDYAAFMRREVFRPLGLARTAIVTAPIGGDTVAVRYDGDQKPIPWYDFDHRGASAAYASARDLARFGMFHLGDRVPGQRAILTRAQLDTMHRLTARRAEKVGYGIGWQTFEDDYGTVSLGHSGGMPGVATVLRIYPAADVVVVVLTNTGDNEAASRIAAEVAAALMPPFAARLAEVRASPPGPLARAEVPAEFRGAWSGTITTWNGPVPLSLVVEGDSARVAVGGVEAVPATGVQWQGGRLTGNVAGWLPPADQSREPGGLAFDLRLHDGILSGSVSALGTGTYALSSYLRLERTR